MVLTVLFAMPQLLLEARAPVEGIISMSKGRIRSCNSDIELCAKIPSKSIGFVLMARS